MYIVPKPKPPILWTLFHVWLIWRRHPHLRLGQLLDNAANSAGRHAPPLFYVRDEDLIKKLKRAFGSSRQH